MKAALLAAISFAVLAGGSSAQIQAINPTAASVQSRAWTPDNGNGTYTNPLMWGDWPDPDIIRVGDDFYFSSTSMHYVPGCPIAHSKDLVNWEMAGYAVSRYDEDPRWDFKGGAMYLRGSWATTLRYNKGKFYLGFAAPGNDPFAESAGNSSHFSMCVADNVRGPWKRTIFKECMYDPSLLFDDDGKVYVIHGQAVLFVTELTPDALAVKTPRVMIWHGAFNPNAEKTGDYKLDKNYQLIGMPPGGDWGMEGSHAYKINGKYYITNPCGGGSGFQICLRSDNIYGPYEWKCICKDSGLHQGGMVQLKNGDWWFIIMQDRGAVGRVPMLEPVKWVDGWPMIGKDGEGKGVTTYAKPNVGATYPINAPATSDEFNSSELGLQWQWNHNPDDEKWSLTERPGYMRLKATRDGRNQLSQRIQGLACEGTTELDVRGLKDGDSAGVGILGTGTPWSYIAVTQQGGERSIEMVIGSRTVATIPNFNGDTIWLRSHAAYPSSFATFFYSTDGNVFKPLGEKVGMGIRGWTANRFALFNSSATDTGVEGRADFNWFHFDHIKPPEATAQSEDGPSYSADVALIGSPDSLRQWVSKRYGGGTKESPLDIWWAIRFFPKPVTVRGVRILGDPRGDIPLQKNLQIQADLSGSWRTVGELNDGTTKDFTVAFSVPVTTNALRLYVPAADLPEDGYVRICKFLLVMPNGSLKEIE